MDNRAWRTNVMALAEDWASGELADADFCHAVLDSLTPGTWACCLMQRPPSSSTGS